MSFFETTTRTVGGGACGACAIELGLTNSAEFAALGGGLLALLVPVLVQAARRELAKLRPWLRRNGWDVTDDGRGVEAVSGPVEGLTVSLPANQPEDAPLPADQEE